MPNSQSARIAVLVDADNTSFSHASDLMEEIAKYGTATVKRAYGDWTTQHLVGWKAELNRHAIQPVQQFAYTTGKNSTDSALIIDAMDLLYAGNFDAFAIVSSDSDFTRLATRLRESGATVYGLGRRRTPESFRAACDRFIYLEVLGGEPEKPASEPDPGQPSLRKLMTKAVDSTSQDDGWATLSAIGNYLVNSHASFDPRNYGFPKLSSLVKAQDYLEARQVGSPAALDVRMKPAQKAAQNPAQNPAQKTTQKAAAKKTAAKKAATKKQA